ncbi:MAG: hypothetical protein ACREMD_11840, partial [Gemmatimonadota bacterium]
PRTVLAAGGFDELYFFYFEDLVAGRCGGPLSRMCGLERASPRSAKNDEGRKITVTTSQQ